VRVIARRVFHSNARVNRKGRAIGEWRSFSWRHKPREGFWPTPPLAEGEGRFELRTAMITPTERGNYQTEGVGPEGALRQKTMFERPFGPSGWWDGFIKVQARKEKIQSEESIAGV